LIACIWFANIAALLTLCLKCTVFEIWRNIGRKSPKNPPHSSLAHLLVVSPCEFFDESYRVPCQKVKSWGYQTVYNSVHDPAFALHARHNSGCDRRTDRQTRRCRKDRAMHGVARVKRLRLRHTAEWFSTVGLHVSLGIGYRQCRINP